ncbi:NDR1/HIN1-like protein 10 [Oryza brachyantha]|uniref:Late embryogenesis abundant protein LEA-2 subgroup domain-containing protein n=1 Tax=Oryza brachyantha TaxID=4533 RepID=J3MPJ8_ORYBR|nr:NDR1/HIN1-like protein 10 [Oryza brachyantha]
MGAGGEVCYPCRRSPLCCALSCVLAVVVCVLAVAIVVYLLFRPNLLRATAAEAELSSFSLALKSWTLSYNLSLGVDLARPNARLVLRYHAIAADAYYQDQRVAHARLPDFAQPAASNTTRLSPAFHGHHQLLGGVAAATFRREDTEGTFSIHVKLAARTEIQALALALPGPPINVDCPLRLQRWNASAPPPVFHPTACHVSY